MMFDFFQGLEADKAETKTLMLFSCENLFSANSLIV